MEYRDLGRTGWNVSTVSFGAWAIGGSWGGVDDKESMAALHRAVDLGVNFIDTADVYGMGRSERLVGQLRRERSETLYVATKAGRRLSPHAAEGYNAENLSRFVEDSLRNLGAEAVDLLQLHCPPRAVYDDAEVFGALDRLVSAGKLRHYGVSVETVDEALRSMDWPNVKTIQIIVNVFRLKPLSTVLPRAVETRTGILARVPLASGLLSGRMTRETSFAKDDHRNFNRHGEAFDAGETFSGVDFETGLEAVEELKTLVPGGATLAQFALRWIQMFPGITCSIPGGRRHSQIEENCAAADLPALSAAQMSAVEGIYNRLIREHVQARW
jgi:aryl-alcohol dehydrogenase-like predicted oxidoreductase